MIARAFHPSLVMAQKTAIRANDAEIDARSQSRSLRAKIIYLVVIVSIIATGVYYSLSPVDPVYRSHARLLFEAVEIEAGGADSAPQQTPRSLSEEDLASQVQLLRSRGLADKVIRKTGLKNRGEFNPTLIASTPVWSFLATIGLDKGPFHSSADELARERFARNLSVYSLDDSGAVAIDFVSQDRQLAAEVTNALIDEFIVLHRSARRDASDDATRWLASEIVSLEGRVREVESELAGIRTNNQLSTDAETPLTPPQRQFAELNEELVEIGAARAEVQARIERIRERLNQGAAFSQSEIVESQTLRKLFEAKRALTDQKDQLSKTATSTDPQLSEITASIADLDRQIRREVENMLGSLENEVQISGARADEIEQRLSEIAASSARTNEPALAIWALEREAAAQQELLSSYLSRYRLALAWRQGDYLPADAQIVSRATPPRAPEFVNIGAITISASALAILFGIALILMRDRMGRGEAKNGAVASQPSLPKKRKSRWPDGGAVRRIMPADPTFAPKVDKGIEEPATALAERIVAGGLKRVLVTIAAAADKGTRPLAAVALARAIARMDRRAVLIDLRPDRDNSISMGEESELPGFSDLFTGKASFSQVIFRDRKSRVHFIPCGSDPLTPEDLLDQRMAMLVSALDHTYDHVIVDLAEDAVQAIAPNCQGALLVSGFDEDDPRTAHAALRIRAVSDAEIFYLPISPAVAGKGTIGADELSSGAAA